MLQFAGKQLLVVNQVKLACSKAAHLVRKRLFYLCKKEQMLSTKLPQEEKGDESIDQSHPTIEIPCCILPAVKPFQTANMVKTISQVYKGQPSLVTKAG